MIKCGKIEVRNYDLHFYILLFYSNLFQIIFYYFWNLYKNYKNWIFIVNYYFLFYLPHYLILFYLFCLFNFIFSLYYDKMRQNWGLPLLYPFLYFIILFQSLPNYFWNSYKNYKNWIFIAYYYFLFYLPYYLIISYLFCLFNFILSINYDKMRQNWSSQLWSPFLYFIILFQSLPNYFLLFLEFI